MLKYKVVRNAITIELANFIKDYFLLRRDVSKTVHECNFPKHSFWELLGIWSDPHVRDTYATYADPATETLLSQVQPIIEENTGLDLVPTYSHARVYKHGDVLTPHKDRPCCEVAVSLHIGGDPWSIWFDDEKVDLGVGDLVTYKGTEVIHWRDRFKGDYCVQAFLFYQSKSNPKLNKYDGRAHLGLPSFLRNNRNRELGIY